MTARPLPPFPTAPTKPAPGPRCVCGGLIAWHWTVATSGGVRTGYQPGDRAYSPGQGQVGNDPHTIEAA